MAALKTGADQSALDLHDGRLETVPTTTRTDIIQTRLFSRCVYNSRHISWEQMPKLT